MGRGNHSVYFLELFAPASLVIALADEHDISGIWVLVFIPWWWRRKTFSSLVVALPVIAIPVVALPVISPPVILSGFVLGGGGSRRSYGGGLGRPRLHCLTVWFAGRSPWFRHGRSSSDS